MTHPLNIPAATPGSAPVQGSVVDRLTADLLCGLVDEHGRPQINGAHGLEVFDLMVETLGLANAAALPEQGPLAITAQHLFANVTEYQRLFAPSENHWVLSGVDLFQGALRWTCTSAEIADVVDVFIRSARSRPLTPPDLHASSFDRVDPADLDWTNRARDEASHPLGRRTLTAPVRSAAQKWIPVLRYCDPTDPSASQLAFPGEPRTAWCVADDPIFSRETAWPDLHHNPCPLPHTSTNPTTDKATGNPLRGLPVPPRSPRPGGGSR